MKTRPTGRRNNMDDDVQHERELREQYEKAHALVHTQEQRARELAFTEINRRLDDMNELRNQIGTERGLYLTRELYDREHKSLAESMDARLKILETNKSNLEGRMWAIGAIISVVVVGLQFAMHYFAK